MISLRPAAERGHARHGWLDSWHSFSFADYLDPRHVHFGPLRVINEDRVKAGAGFPPHRHEDMEIISYVLDGELEHRDSLGNGSIIRPGDVQRMSAGRGVSHSEFNPSRTAALHFLQIWIIPEVRGIEPEYEQRHVSAAERRGRLRLVASPDGAEESLRIHQDARVYAGLFDGAETAALALAPGRLGYVHLARGALSVNGQALQAGDGAQLQGTEALALSTASQAEVLVFDLPQD
ncbi:MAG TPA: pirin family protein [Steroidobacteraceae bacterium]|nr:pirin family protein [Steroidobacteraceae bacterium]